MNHCYPNGLLRSQRRNAKTNAVTAEFRLMYAFLPLRAVPYAAPYKKQKIIVYKRRSNGFIDFIDYQLIILDLGHEPGLDQKPFLKL